MVRGSRALRQLGRACAAGLARRAGHAGLAHARARPETLSWLRAKVAITALVKAVVAAVAAMVLAGATVPCELTTAAVRPRRVAVHAARAGVAGLELVRSTGEHSGHRACEGHEHRQRNCNCKLSNAALLATMAIGSNAGHVCATMRPLQRSVWAVCAVGSVATTPYG